MIRLAQPQDLEAVADCIVALRSETVWAHVIETPNRDYILSWLWKTLTTNADHALYVAERDGEIIGCCGGELVTGYFVPDKRLLTEWAWYVKPAYRYQKLGWQLWTALTDWARTRGAIGAVYAKAIPTPDLSRRRPFEQRVWMNLEEQHVVRRAVK